MSAMLTLGVALAGSLGAVARFALDSGLTSWLDRRPERRTGHRPVRGGRFPWATLLINVSGSLLLGILAGLSAGGHLSAAALTVLGVGFCGGYTTFSTAIVGAVTLLRARRYAAAAANALGTLALCVAAAALGVWLTR